MMKTINIIAKDVQLMVEDEKLGEAVASISLNPNVIWLKMVITDDKPNANNMRIPKEEFANVIKTAVYMPLKMAEGQIAEGHERALPLGSIAHLIDNDDHIVALAALWSKERPEDVKFLKDRYENGQSIDVSWELNYDVTASVKNDDGVLNLKNVEMNAVTIVSLPSYTGRTNVTALASQDDNESGETEAMDTINREDHDKIVVGLNDKIEELSTELDASKIKVEELSTSNEGLASAKTELDELKPKFEKLETFKADADAAKEKQEKLDSIRKKFKEAGLEANDEYFTDERKETLLGMEEAALDFFVQELIAFKAEPEEDSDEALASLSITSNLPDVKRKGDKEVGREDILGHLQDLDKKEDKK